MKTLRRFSAAAAAAAAMFAAAGCESAETHGVTIKVSKREVTAVGETVTLSASGWSEYDWSLSNTTIGRLSGTKGSSVVYTVLEIPATNSTHVLQTVTCQAIDGSGGGAYETVEIRHMAPEGTPGSASAPVNTATSKPAASSGSGSGGYSGSGSSGTAREAPVLNTTSETAELGEDRITTIPLEVQNAVSGHTYRWTVSPSGYGSVSPSTGPRTTYTAPMSATYRGRNATVRCTDTTTSLSASCTISLQ